MKKLSYAIIFIVFLISLSQINTLAIASPPSIRLVECDILEKNSTGSLDVECLTFFYKDYHTDYFNFINHGDTFNGTIYWTPEDFEYHQELNIDAKSNFSMYVGFTSSCIYSIDIAYNICNYTIKSENETVLTFSANMTNIGSSYKAEEIIPASIIPVLGLVSSAIILGLSIFILLYKKKVRTIREINKYLLTKILGSLFLLFIAFLTMNFSLTAMGFSFSSALNTSLLIDSIFLIVFWLYLRKELKKYSPVIKRAIKRTRPKSTIYLSLLKLILIVALILDIYAIYRTMNTSYLWTLLALIFGLILIIFLLYKTFRIKIKP
jgi:hypothetical protein